MSGQPAMCPGREEPLCAKVIYKKSIYKKGAPLAIKPVLRCRRGKMSNFTRSDLEWQAVMTSWLASNTDLDVSTVFSDDEYGLLNAAKFFNASQAWMVNNDRSEDETELFDSAGAKNSSSLSYFVNNSLVNFSHTDIISRSPSRYGLPEIIILSIIITAVMVVIVIGNMLVVIAIATENSLTTVQNWFIASLAVADMLIGLVIMPFSLSYLLMNYWMFGEVWCDIHAATDVLLCTSSIMNMCLISLDRYWSITKAISYLNQRTPNRGAIMIISVWVLSGIISIPPLFGWKEDVDLDWFFDILSERGNRTQMEFLQDLQQSGQIDIQNFTKTLESIVYPQCSVSQDFLNSSKIV